MGVKAPTLEGSVVIAARPGEEFCVGISHVTSGVNPASVPSTFALYEPVEPDRWFQGEEDDAVE